MPCPAEDPLDYRFIYRMFLESEYGYEVVSIESFGRPVNGHQVGDHVALLRHGDRWGWWTISYGSCQDCDGLAQCGDQLAVDLLMSRARDTIRWDTATELAAWLLAEPANAGGWGYQLPEFRQHLASTASYLRGEHASQDEGSAPPRHVPPSCAQAAGEGERRSHHDLLPLRRARPSQ